MPYKVIKTDSEYCVHKENADGSVGEKVACHETKAMADDQVKALYANEADKSVEIEIEVEGGESENETAVVGAIDPMVIGFRAYAQYIESAWEEESQEDLRYSHVREIFGDHIIVAMGYGMNARMFSVPYSIDGEDVEFKTDNMTQVQLKTEWVAKSAEFDINPYTVKSLGADRVGGFAVVWGNENRRDLDNQWFTKNTLGYLDVFKAMGKLPWLFDHAADGKIKSTVVGEIDKMEIVDDIGVWFEAKILEHEIYKKYISKLVQAKALFSSSGALPYSVKVAKSGEITSFSVVEVSGTHHPADHFQVLDGFSVSEMKSRYDKLGIDSTELFADENETEISDDNGQDAEEAAVVDGSKELFELAQDWLELQKLQVEI